MKKAVNGKLTVVLAVIGALLILSAVSVMIITQVSKGMAEEKARETVTKIRSLMPEGRDGVTNKGGSAEMPMLEVDGTDYVGLVEIPAYSCELPVQNEWNSGSVTKVPCRFTGSAYDGTLVIGGSDNEGQFDFMKLITGGDVVIITDASGYRYKYTVTDIEKTKDVSAENLCDDTADLTLFARNTYGFDYTVVRCKYK